MIHRSVQVPAAVVMIRPHHFTINPETAADNVFQDNSPPCDINRLSQLAQKELTVAAERLREQGVVVHIFEDESCETPDSVFPNNWFSTHAGGHIAIYPMLSPARRKERRSDVIDMLKHTYRVQDVVDYSGLEQDGLFLEGTGAMVLDHIDRIAYAARSSRTDPIALERFCTHFNYEPMVFDAVDENSVPIYHTNVLMCVATSFVMICLDMIRDSERREEIVHRIRASGRDVIDLDMQQIRNFAGNALELQGKRGRLLVLSSTARRSLTQDQVELIENSAELLALDIPTIEKAGGSVRCTLAGIHLSPRQRFSA